MRSPLDDTIISAYYRFCNKSCPIMFAKDHCGYDGQDEIYERYCERCIVKVFIENELEIDMKY